MLRTLAEAIRDDEPEVMRIFSDEFARGADWHRFMDSYGEPPDLEGILTEETGWDDKPTCLRRFQTIYIACWIYHPLEKGTFMLSLHGAKSNVERGYQTLDRRWSSHLSKQARSAGEGFTFLKGYNELLVQIEGDFLFLKAEGQRASGAGIVSSARHLGGWVRKSVTGVGNTASRELNDLVVTRPDLGIRQRSAENYGKKYEALLKHLDLHGPLITIRLALDELIEECLQSADGAASFLTLLGENGFDRNLVNTQGLTHRDMGRLLRNVVRPFMLQSPETRLRKLIRHADNEIDGLIECLLSDLELLDSRSSRYFHEVRTSPSNVTDALRDFAVSLGPGVERPVPAGRSG
jgi:hypothetical protein